MMKKLLLAVGWLTVTPIFLFYLIITANKVSHTKHFSRAVESSVKVVATESPYRMFSALPEQVELISNSIESEDARSLIITNWLTAYKAPLAPYGDVFVKAADKYGLDWRLLPAISMKESGGGRAIPVDSYNAWGWGIYGDQVLRFDSWEDGIYGVAAGLKKSYLDQGLTTPEQIMAKYTPPSLEIGGPWAQGVQRYFAELSETE
ncbi:glucosaminidase domain-containing protein [Candidatus Curtissbacteria bacterium]|nr:glucosaminidase domain-containing protein [Candidatus Curtissbacteria bacterium]